MKTPTAPLPLAALLVLSLMACGAREDDADSGNSAPPPAADSAQGDGAKVDKSPEGVFRRALQAQVGDSGALHDYYAARDWAPYFARTEDTMFRDPGFSAEARTLLTELEDSLSHGLNPGEYKVDELRKLVDQPPKEMPALADGEARLMQAYLTLARHLAEGREAPQPDVHDWYIPHAEFKAKTALAELETRDVAAALRSFWPQLLDYQRLREARSRFAKIVAEGGYPSVGGDGLIEPGDESPEIPDLRQRLFVGGELAWPEPRGAASENPNVYDEDTVEALKKFQRRFGIEDDGIIGPGTRDMLNYPAKHRLAQIDANLERLRWLPQDLGPDRIMVNVAAFHLRGYKDNQVVMRMRVIVGEEQNQTPAFSDTLEYVEVNPYWTVPNSIIVGEIAPKMVEDPGYLARKNMMVQEDWPLDSAQIDPANIDWAAYAHAGADFPYILRQRPGPDNALGQIKFMFPNDFAIYLHDTPTDHLFDEVDRTFSHGCIRLEYPVEFAGFVFDDTPDWDAQRVKQTIDSAQHTQIGLSDADKIPVYIYYNTAWADADGTIYFRPDRYGRDDVLIQRELRDPL